MTGFLTPKEKRKLKPAETGSFAAPIPTQVVSSDEYFPEPQTSMQRAVEAHIRQFGADTAAKLGISRRAFFATAAGMAAAFLAMNMVYPISLINITLNGSSPVVVQGTPDAYRMIPFRDQLNDGQLAEVVSFIRTSWGNKAAAVSPRQVGKIRDKTDPVRYYELDLLRMR
jgi:hypothetical protein